MDPSMLPARISAKIGIDRETDCWLWQAGLGTDGYGRVWMPGSSNKMTHRVIYELLVDEIPFGLHLDHTCGTRRCVNPAHLDPVHWRENNRRAGLKRRQETCVRGHVMEGENVGVRPSSEARYCRECNTAQAREWRSQDREAKLAQHREEYRNRSPEWRQRQAELRQDPEYKRRAAERSRRVRAQLRADGKPCSVDGCGKPAGMARGLCSTHYSRWYRNKEVMLSRSSFTARRMGRARTARTDGQPELPLGLAHPETDTTRQTR
jgi:hypothetical protein